MERKVWVSASGIIIQGLQMITAKLWISDTVLRNSDAYEILKEFAEKNGITGKEYYHLGLLTEETLGMANQILHVYDGELWVEGTAAGYEIILEATVHENDGGKTVPAASPEGFMAKIAEMMKCSYMFENNIVKLVRSSCKIPDILQYAFEERFLVRIFLPVELFPQAACSILLLLFVRGFRHPVRVNKDPVSRIHPDFIFGHGIVLKNTQRHTVLICQQPVTVSAPHDSRILMSGVAAAHVP